MADAQTQEYFDREKDSWFLLEDYLSASNDIDKVEIAQEILGETGVEDYVVYLTEEDENWDEVPVLDEDWNKELDERDTDRDWLDEAVRDYFEPLSIEKWCKVDPYSNEVVDTDDCRYEIQISAWWPNVFREIDYSAELHLYWWGTHLSRDFWSAFADTLLSFYWLD